MVQLMFRTEETAVEAMEKLHGQHIASLCSLREVLWAQCGTVAKELWQCNLLYLGLGKGIVKRWRGRLW